MSSNSRKPMKLQLRLYPEKNEQHRRALAWLMEHKTDGVSYADLIAQAICRQNDRQLQDEAEERVRRIVREEIQGALRGVTINAISAGTSMPAQPKAAGKSLSKAKGFMAGMGFG